MATPLMFVSLLTLAVASDVDYSYDDLNILTELPIRGLLAQKRGITYPEEPAPPTALPLVGNHSAAYINPIENMQIKGLHRLPIRKTIFDDEEDDYDWLPKKKSKSKFSKLFEVSVTTLSFLAFGSYLLCLMVSVMKQRSTDALAAVGTNVSPQIQLLQQILGTTKPIPVRIPASSFAVHSGRRRRSSPYSYYETKYSRK